MIESISDLQEERKRLHAELDIIEEELKNSLSDTKNQISNGLAKKVINSTALVSILGYGIKRFSTRRNQHIPYNYNHIQPTTENYSTTNQSNSFWNSLISSFVNMFSNKKSTPTFR